MYHTNPWREIKSTCLHNEVLCQMKCKRKLAKTSPLAFNIEEIDILDTVQSGKNANLLYKTKLKLKSISLEGTGLQRVIMHEHRKASTSWLPHNVVGIETKHESLDLYAVIRSVI